MIWQCAQYIFLKSETSFEILGENLIISHPEMVSMSKTKLNLKENVTCTLSNHDFVQILWYLEDVKDVQKNLGNAKEIVLANIPQVFLDILDTIRIPHVCTLLIFPYHKYE